MESLRMRWVSDLLFSMKERPTEENLEKDRFGAR